MKIKIKQTINTVKNATKDTARRKHKVNSPGADDNAISEQSIYVFQRDVP